MTTTAPQAADSRIQASDARHFGCPTAGWRRRAFIIIFESDTPAGKAFDVALLVAILLSVAVVMADSVDSLSARYGELFNVLEWLFTLFFTVEYLTRLACVDRPALYARSFFGLVDLLSVIPTYLALFFPGVDALIDIRLLRLLRVFRVLKVTAYMAEYSSLGAAIWASRRRIVVFIGTVFMIVVLLGTLMYVVEGPANGFTSIPISVYWAITTMTTVGYGDITPQTDFGRLIASLMMLLGWGTLAVPTGIVTAEMTARRFGSTGPAGALRTCTKCSQSVHAADARFCHSCGAELA